jgi:elongation factor G
MLLMHANNREDIKEAYAGDIVALAGLKEPAPVTRCAIPEAGHPREDGIPRAGHRDRDRAEVEGRPGKAGRGAGQARAEDPSFRVSTDHESGQTILKGMGELHLDIKVDILKRTYKVEANIGAPQVAYRESLGKPADIDYTHKKQTGGTGQFARVKIKFEPNEPAGFVFENKIVGGAVPKEYIPGVEKGLSRSGRGVLAGFPVVDVKVACRRRLSRRRLVGARVRNRGARRLREGCKRARRSCSSRS